MSFLSLLFFRGGLGLGESSGMTSAALGEVVITSKPSAEMGATTTVLYFPFLASDVASPSKQVLGFLFGKVFVTTLLSIAQGNLKNFSFLLIRQLITCIP